MENQHQKIKGYRNLSAESIALMNRLKRHEAEIITTLNELATLDNETVSKRELALGKTNLQQGFMWAVRSIAQPDEVPAFTMEEKQ